MQSPLTIGVQVIEKVKNQTPLGGFEPPTFRLTAERANRLRHKGSWPEPRSCYIKIALPIRAYAHAHSIHEVAALYSNFKAPVVLNNA